MIDIRAVTPVLSIKLLTTATLTRPLKMRKLILFVFSLVVLVASVFAEPDQQDQADPLADLFAQNPKFKELMDQLDEASKNNDEARSNEIFNELMGLLSKQAEEEESAKKDNENVSESGDYEL